jgi:hypothetical protein
VVLVLLQPARLRDDLTKFFRPCVLVEGGILLYDVVSALSCLD